MKNNVFGATLLVAGTAIGAGMLALPVSMSANGFIGALLIMVALWSVMLLSALFMLEVALSLPVGTNLVSMADATLGTAGRWIVWCLYLGLLYALNAAYLNGLMMMIQPWFVHLILPPALMSLLLLIAFMSVMWFGVRGLDHLNRLLVFGLVICYLLMMLKLLPMVNLQQLNHMHMQSSAWATLPIVIVAYGFHIVIPSIRNYCGNDKISMIKSLVWGASIPLLVYLLWQISIMGVIPSNGAYGLKQMLISAQPAVDLPISLVHFFPEKHLGELAKSFAGFAIATSFIGVSLSLSDFFADALQWSKRGRQGFVILLLTFVPPLMCAMYYPKVFIGALAFGGLFVAILLAILPTLMVAKLRLNPAYQPKWQVPGGVWSMLWVLLVGLAVLVSPVFA